MKDSELTTHNDLQQELVETQENLRVSLEGKQQLIGKLKKTRREYLAIFDSVPAMIWYRDQEGRILKVNQCAADSVGMGIRDLVGKNYYELFPDGAERARQQDLEVMETGLPLRGQLRSFTAFNGLQRWALVDRIPLRNEDGRIGGVMVFAMDITEKKRTEEDLVTAKVQIEQTNRRLKATAEQARLLAEKATRSNRAKSELLASSSHDLRTPMNSIIGFAEILMDTGLDEEQKEYVKTIRQAAQGLLSLINDILDYSRIEAGKLNIEIVSCNIVEAVSEVRAMMETSAKKKGLDFKVSIDERLPATFFTDPTRLKQCLINLVGNAIKFTESGHVGIYVRPDEHAGQACICFEVEDTGIGIPQDKQDVIFKSFSQADISTARKYGGTGLGLAISRRLAGLLGGDVRLKSKIGTGSTFTLTLPLFVQQTYTDGPICLGSRPTRRSNEITEPFAGRILLAEKAFPSQLTMTLMLRRFGLEVELAGSLELARKCLNRQSFDLIIVDAAFGYHEATSFLDDLHRNTPGFPVILVADHDNSEAEDFRKAGFSDCLYRPLGRDQLFEAIRMHLPDEVIDSSKGATDDTNGVVSAESILERLPELARGIRDVMIQSDTELLTRFAELFSEIGQAAGQETLKDLASKILDCTRTLPDSAQELTILVDELCDLCDHIQQEPIITED